jgi:hypothetical protein
MKQFRIRYISIYGNITRKLPVSIFISNKQKCHVSFFLLQNWRIGGQQKSCDRGNWSGCWYKWERGSGGERGLESEYGAKMWGEDKGELCRGEFKYDIFDL